MEHGILGQNVTYLGQNGTAIQGKMAYFNKRMREYSTGNAVMNYLHQFSAEGVRNTWSNASIVIRINYALNESQIVRSYYPWGQNGTQYAVLPQGGHKMVNIIFSNFSYIQSIQWYIHITSIERYIGIVA